MGRRQRRLSYLAHVVPGLEPVAEEEMRSRLGKVEVADTLRRFDERSSLLLFSMAAPARELLALRTVEDVFAVVLDSKDVPPNWRGIQAIRAAVGQAAPRLEAAAHTASEIRPRRKGKVAFRIIARKAGEHAYRRVDVQRAVELGVLDRFPGWRPEEEGGIELWASLVGSRLLLGVRLSDNSLRQRRWREASVPAALKPTVAAAMVLLSEPRDDDVFLDPMCGSGTIVIERALAGRYHQLLGGDSDPEALQAARENIGPRHKPIRIEQWDARALPLDDGSVSAIVCNLPFGKQIGTPAEVRRLYPAVLAECARVLVPRGRMVLLTSERNLLQRSLEHRPELHVTRQLSVLVRGQPATIFVIGEAASGTNTTPPPRL